MARLKEFTLTGFAADDDAYALAQALLNSTAADPNGLAESQAIDTAADVDNLAAAQNPNNAADTNDYATAQTYTNGVGLTLQGAAGSISPSRRISMTSATNESATNFTIVGVGVDANGAAITGEVLAGPNANTVNSVNAYSSITSITPNATDAVDTVSVGFPAYLDLGLTLEVLAAELIPPRNISITSGAAADFSNVDITVIGTDGNGVAASETLGAGPNNSTVSTTGFFGSVTAINFQRTAVSVSANISAGYIANSVPQQLTLDGALGNGLGAVSDVFPAAKVTLTSGDNLSALTFTIVGLGTNGLAQQEVVTGPNVGTVTSVGIYTRVTSITPSDDAAGAVEAGIAAGAVISALVLEAAAASISPARELSFDSNGDINAVNFTIVGKDRNGYDQTESLNGVTTTAVLSKKLWSSVTSITPDAASTQTVVVGFQARTPTPWVVCGLRKGVEQVPTAQVSFLILSGAADGIVEVSYDSPGEEEPTVDETVAITPGTPVDAQGVMCRVVLTSGAATSAEARIAQPGP